MQRFVDKLPSHFIGDKTLIGIGESNHSSHEFFEAKANIFKDLVINHGYSTFLLEDTPADCQPIQRYIESGEGELGELMNRLYSIWQCAELAGLISWMHNVDKPLQFVGFDADQSKIDMKKRDQIMSENIIGIVENRGGKAMVWAHNTHIQKSMQTEAAEAYSLPMGHFLKEHFGDNYAAVGQFALLGSFRATKIDIEHPHSTDHTLSTINIPATPPDYLEAALASQMSGNYFLDLAQLPKPQLKIMDKIYPARSIGWGLVPDEVNYYTEPTNVMRQFDGLIFYERTSPSQPI